MTYIENAKEGMEGVIEILDKRLINVRAGRANPNMLNNVIVDYYGTPTPLTAIANITVPEARELFVKPFDRASLKNIEKAINEANLGINPTNNGEMIILTLPVLTEDKRREYVKEAKAMGEDAKIGLRTVRQDINNAIKKAELTEDEEKKSLEEVQNLITKYNKIVDDKIKEKEGELMEI